MKLNLELLDKIKEEVGRDFYKKEKPKVSEINWKWDNLMISEKVFLFPEVCRRYSEQIIKCDMCDGNGEKEGHHDTLGDCLVICSFCEGEGYLKD